MDFRCHRCGTRYLTTQPTRAGRAYQYTCRRCGNALVVVVPVASRAGAPPEEPRGDEPGRGAPGAGDATPALASPPPARPLATASRAPRRAEDACARAVLAVEPSASAEAAEAAREPGAAPEAAPDAPSMDAALAAAPAPAQPTPAPGAGYVELTLDDDPPVPSAATAPRAGPPAATASTPPTAPPVTPRPALDPFVIPAPALPPRRWGRRAQLLLPALAALPTLAALGLLFALRAAGGRPAPPIPAAPSAAPAPAPATKPSGEASSGLAGEVPFPKSLVPCNLGKVPLPPPPRARSVRHARTGAGAPARQPEPARAPAVVPPAPQQEPPPEEEEPVSPRPGYRRPAPLSPGCVERSLRVPQPIIDRLPGSVIVRFAVDRDGTAGKVQALPGPDRLPGERIEPEILAAITAAVTACRFTPGTDDQGVPTRMWLIMKLRFDGRG